MESCANKKVIDKIKSKKGSKKLSKQFSKTNYWFNEDCQQARKESRYRQHRWEKTRSYSDMVDYKKAKAKFRIITKKAKTQADKNYMGPFDITTTAKESWEKLNKIFAFEMEFCPNVKEDEATSEDSETDTESTETSHSTPYTTSAADYNTDDKLSPVLNNISISKPQKQTFLKTGKHSSGVKKPSSVPLFPYGSNPLPVNSQPSTKRQRHDIIDDDRSSCAQSDTSDVSSYEQYSIAGNRNNNSRAKQNKNQIASYVHDSETENTDTSNYSTVFQYASNHAPSFPLQHTSVSRPFYPDMNSASWYQAKCFDSYWRNYSFVSSWYQEHMNIVHRLTTQPVGIMGPPRVGTPKKPSSKSSRKSRSSKRAKNRRRAKERHRALKQQETLGETTQTEAADTSGSEDGDDMEMEITEEMLEFFATSQKHKMERDIQKQEMDQEQEDVHINIEQVVSGQQAPSASAPKEQPGLRRTEEMKVLYGADAPMIHGMETALQLTFDRITDKCQPKLWPNMPLKINFG